MKQSDREVDQLHPSSAEVKNEWSHTSAPPLMPTCRVQGQLYFAVLFSVNVKSISVCNFMYFER